MKEVIQDHTHWAEIIKLVQLQKTPQAIRSNYKLRDPVTSETIYSERAIIQAVELIRAGHTAPPEVQEEPPPPPVTPLPSGITSRRPLIPGRSEIAPSKEVIHRRSDRRQPIVLFCPALDAATGLAAPIPVPGFSWADVTSTMHDIARQLGLAEDPGRLTLVHRNVGEDQPNVILSERVFRGLAEGGKFEVLLTARTPVQSRVESPAPPASVMLEAISRRLSFDSNLTSSSAVSVRQTQAKYERAVKADLITDVQAEFKTTTTTSILCSSLEITLDSIRKMDKVWSAVLRNTSENDDGISTSKRLEWFIEACLGQLEEPAKLKWNNQAEAQRDASSYTSLTAFLKQLFLVVVPAKAITRPTALIESLSTTISRTNIDSLEHLLAKVEHQVQLAQTFGCLIKHSEQNLLDAAELTFWRQILSPTTQDALAQALHIDPKATPVRFQVTEGQEQPFDCYSVQDVRRTIKARSNRQSDWTEDIIWPAASRATGQGTPTSRPPSRASAAPSPAASGRQGGSGAEKELRTFKSDFDGSQVSLPHKLRQEPSHQLKQQYEATFLKHNIFPQAVCKNRLCGLKGHTIHICPLFSRCDAQGIERNPRSFFEGLALPRAALTLPRPSRGSSAPEPVMLVTPTAPSLSAIDMQSPEFQAAVQAVLQASRQRANDLGNDRAGAAQ